jgi:hypothetical protein
MNAQNFSLAAASCARQAGKKPVKGIFIALKDQLSNPLPFEAPL